MLKITHRKEYVKLQYLALQFHSGCPQQLFLQPHPSYEGLNWMYRPSKHSTSRRNSCRAFSRQLVFLLGKTAFSHRNISIWIETRPSDVCEGLGWNEAGFPPIGGGQLKADQCNTCNDISRHFYGNWVVPRIAQFSKDTGSFFKAVWQCSCFRSTWEKCFLSNKWVASADVSLSDVWKWTIPFPIIPSNNRVHQ